MKMITVQSMFSNQNRRAAGAFSLVETVLALAVMGLSLSVLLGLLPHGLEMSRKAGVSAGESRVVTDLVAELSQASWSKLAAYHGARYLYDDQGVRLSGGPGAAPAADSDDMPAFVALVDISTPANMPGTGDVSNNLRRVVLKIASTNKESFDFEADGASFSTVTTLLAKRD